MERPDVSQGIWERAKADARVRSLNSLAGLAITAAGGALGAEVTSWPEWNSSAASASATVIGTLIGIGLGLGAFLVVQLLLAARRQRDELRGYLTSLEEMAQARRQFKAACHAWADEVERFVDAREALEPTRPKASLTEILTSGYPEEDAAVKAERERIIRESISLYISQYRDTGLSLFDQLIRDGYIVEAGRPSMASPKRVSDIRESADRMRTAADRV